MSDNDEKPRPNAGYSLSNRGNHDGIVWHYNRERRLTRAPQIVQEMYKEQKPRRFGLFGIAFLPRSITFFSIIIVCIMILIATFAMTSGNTHSFEGNRLSIQTEKTDGITIVTLEKNAKGFFARLRRPYTGAVDITIFTPQGSEQGEGVINRTIVFSREALERSVFTVPFDADELVFVLKTEKTTLGITVAVDLHNRP